MTHSNGDRLDRLEVLAETTLLAIQQLATQQRQTPSELAASISDVVSIIASNSQHIEEMQAEVRGLQMENRYILEELADIRRQNGQGAS